MLSEFNNSKNVESKWSALLAGIVCVADMGAIFLLLALISEGGK